jgi:multiple sugar transport system ATP-binding protein
MAEVELTDVRKVFPARRGPGVPAVDGVSLTVNKGELLVLVGPSGCGKTTLLRLVAGLEDLDGGSIRIGDQVVNEVAPKDRDVAMVFQNYALFPHMTAFENIAFGIKFRGVPRDEIHRRVDEAARLLQLGGLLERRPHELSGGQRQRVALGRAIVRQPLAFLLDEPLSNLDAQMRLDTRAELARLHARLSATMIFVTHDQAEAMTLGQRLCVMRGGKVMQVGAPMEIYRQPANLFVAQFIGSPGMNLLHGTLTAESGEPVFQLNHQQGAPLRLKLNGQLASPATGKSGQRLVLGLRPEDLRVTGAGGGTSDGQASFEARVDVCEPLGHETLLYLSAGSQPLVARVPGGESFGVGQSVRVACRLEFARLFDAETENALAN